MNVDAARCWASLQAIRREAPLVQNITNFVSMDVVANGLLALGASPAMVHAREEVVDFAKLASALVVNIGTLTPPWVESMVKAAESMKAKGKPWVLDPVGVGATPYRTRTASQLAVLKPSVIRANASEVLALAGDALGPTKGVDSTHGSDEAIETADHLAGQLGTIVAVTGAVDYVTDGKRSLRVGNGHPMMTQVTALGCTASSVVGAFLVVEEDALAAAAEALSVFGLAAERAVKAAEGPGSLRWRLLDQLSALDEAALNDGVRIG
jgi:hydroxyethylthiazole kinase